MNSESRKLNSIRNIIFGYGNQILTLLLSFIGRTVFIKVLGEDYLGINGLFSDVLMMLSMADLGFGTAMVYSFYRPVAEHDEKRIAALIHFYKKIYNFIAVVVAVVGVMLVPFLKYLVNLDQGIPYLKIYYLFFLANTVISYLFVYKTSIINASQKNYLISQYQAIVNVVKTVVQIAVLLMFHNYFVYLFINIAATLANNLIASHKADLLYPEIRAGHEELDPESKRSIFGNMKSIFLYKVSGVLLNGTDNTLISIIVGTVWVGIYSNYNMIVSAVNNFINTIFSSVTASIGNVIVTEKPEKRYEVFKVIQTISLITASATVVIMYSLMNDLIFVWLGEKFVLSNEVLIAIMCNFYLGNILRPIWSYREATGLYMQTKYIMLIAAAINLVLSIGLGNLFGLSGILFASAIARLSTYFWYEPNLLFKNYFEENVGGFYLSIVKNLLLVVVLSIVIFWAGRFFEVDTWGKLILKAVIVGIVTVLGVVCAYIRTKECKMLLQMAMGILKKVKGDK